MEMTDNTPSAAEQAEAQTELANLLALAKAIGYGGEDRYESYGIKNEGVKSMSIHEKGLVTLKDAYGVEVVVPFAFVVTVGVQLELVLNDYTHEDYDHDGNLRGGSKIQYEPNCYVITHQISNADGSGYTTISTVKEGEPSEVFAIEINQYQQFIDEISAATDIEEFWLSEAPHDAEDPYVAGVFERLAEDFKVHRISEMMKSRKLKTVAILARRIKEKVGNADPKEYVLEMLNDVDPEDPVAVAEALGVGDLLTPSVAEHYSEPEPKLTFDDFDGDVPTFRDLPPHLI